MLGLGQHSTQSHTKGKCETRDSLDAMTRSIKMGLGVGFGCCCAGLRDAVIVLFHLFLLISIIIFMTRCWVYLLAYVYYVCVLHIYREKVSSTRLLS